MGEATATVERGAIEQIAVRSGLVRVESEPLSFEFSGNFSAFYAFPGDRVTEGQLLALLDTEGISDNITSLESELAFLYRDNSISDQIFVYEMLAMELRYRELSRSDGGTASANGILLDIERAVLRNEQENELRVLDIADIRRRLDVFRAELAQMELRAPMDGYITFIMPIEYGNIVAAGETVLFFNHSQDVFIDYVGEALPRQLSEAHRITAIVNGNTYELEHVPMTGEMILFHRVYNLPLRWRFYFATDQPPPYSSYASLWFYTIWIPDALRIPVNSIIFGDAGPYTYRIIGGESVMTPIRFGVRSDSFAEVLYGLEEGDVVLVR